MPDVGLSKELVDFYEKHNVNIQASSSTDVCRFVRLNPRFQRAETLDLLQEELGEDSKVVPVNWLDNETYGFYAIPGTFSISSSACFQSGRIYAMDISSGAAVAALLSSTYDKGSSAHTDVETKSEHSTRILDLCCCPGLKLCMIADLAKDSAVVGVDVHEQRLSLCKKIVQKYHLDPETRGNQSETSLKPSIRLYCQDGTTFGSPDVDTNLIFDSGVAAEDFAQRGTRKRMNKSARARERKRLKQVASNEWYSTPSQIQTDGTNAQTEGASGTARFRLFDKVLVDAECSTDGSLKHVEQKIKALSSGEAKNELLTDPQQLADLVDLQKRLISNGFHLLKPGGKMVYSTCSLSVDQNENVVQYLLETFKQSFIIPVSFPEAKSKLVSEGKITGTIRFLPNVGDADSKALFGGGFFLAKIGKSS